jgi:type II secretory pathway pseudopilin PulG
MRLRIKCTKGITLVEVLVSVLLIAVVTVAVLATLANSITFSEKADVIYEASLLAQQRLDLLKNVTFNDIADVGEETDTELDTDGDTVTDFFRTTAITENYDGYSDLIKVKVSVYKAVSGVKTGTPVIMETLYSEAGAKY